MKSNVYNIEGKMVKDIELSDDIFGVKVKPEVVHQVFVQMTANQREPWAHTKDRGDVSGGGKKPWAQKGTGRARHGSIRSPLWVGGGVTFGPTNERNYKTKINKKTRRLATQMCLADKAQSNALWVIDSLTFSEPKTKLFDKMIKSLPAEQKTFFVLTGDDERNITRLTANLPKVKTVRAEDVNVMDLLTWQGVVASEAALKKIEEIYKK